MRGGLQVQLDLPSTNVQVMASDGFAIYLRHAMDQAGFETPAQLARTSGISDQQISRWLNEKTLPSVAHCRRLASYLGVGLLDILVAAGHLTPAEAGGKPDPKSAEAAIRAADFSDHDKALMLAMLREIRRRAAQPPSPPQPRKHQGRSNAG